jgi:hypothetical protein
MLVLFNSHKKQIHTFKTYDALFHHLENLERIKGKGKWIFARHSRQHMISCYRYVRDRNVCAQSAETFEEGLEEALKQAIAGKLVPAKDEGGGNFDIIEVINGNVKNPVFIRVTPDVDVEALRKRWCEDYCKAHGYTLVEVFSPADLTPFEKQIGGKDGDAHK